jgi:hypothetical protein
MWRSMWQVALGSSGRLFPISGLSPISGKNYSALVPRTHELRRASVSVTTRDEWLGLLGSLLSR